MKYLQKTIVPIISVIISLVCIYFAYRKIDFNLLKKNLDCLCEFIINKINLKDLGYRISKGNGFARIIDIKNKAIASRGFIFNNKDSDLRLDEYCRDKKIYIAKNRLLFPSIYNINKYLSK